MATTSNYSDMLYEANTTSWAISSNSGMFHKAGPNMPIMPATNFSNMVHETESKFSCGGCKSLFEDIGLLSFHMRDHVEGGSFNYNHVLRTAFPVSVSKDASTQTDNTYENEVQNLHSGESMMSKDSEAPLVHTVDSLETEEDSSDTLFYGFLKTEASNDQPFTYRVDNELFMSDPAGSTKYFDKQPKAVKNDGQDSDSGEKMDTEQTEKETEQTEKAYIKCKKCKKLIKSKQMKKHLATFHKITRTRPTKAGGRKKKSVKTAKHLSDKIEETAPDKESEHEDNSKVAKSENDAENDFVCETCGKHVKTIKYLRRHIKNVHEADIKPRSECEICGKKVKNLKIHVQNMHVSYVPRGPAICETCGKVYPTTKSLARHKIVHTEKYLTCRYCSHLSATHEEFQAHLRMHRLAKRYPCHICSAVYNTPGNIHKHIRSVHMGEKRFFCDVCNKGFYTKTHWECHRAIHFEPTLKCSFCDRMFKEAGSKRIHERIHRGDQRYRCHICNHGFVQSGCYWSHMLKRHSIPKEEAMKIREQLLNASSDQTNDNSQKNMNYFY